MRHYDIVIVGAGISGATLAERYASQKNASILVIDKRDHIGGNCHDYIDANGILISRYGPHYFHTNSKEVWDYVSRFTAWTPYEHRVLAHVDGKKVPVPINRTTVNKLFGLQLASEQEMQAWLDAERIQIEDPKNSEEVALSLIGKRLYEKIFKGYTKKQWDKDPKDLAPSVIKRIPVRLDEDDRYFSDTYQAVPKDGYTAIFDKMFDDANITLKLSTDWNDIRHEITFGKLFFTGKIDGYFGEALGKLEYRSLRFDFETIKREFFQDAAQENYPDPNVPFTRIVEYKRSTGQDHPFTVISREYPTWEGEPYYPVPSETNHKLYEQYQIAAKKAETEGVFFVGRLANYKYLNMDQAFENALRTYSETKDIRGLVIGG